MISIELLVSTRIRCIVTVAILDCIIDASLNEGLQGTYVPQTKHIVDPENSFNFIVSHELTKLLYLGFPTFGI